MCLKPIFFWSIFSAIYSMSCVDAVRTQNLYPLEFITQEYASVSAMKYGFQLLEDIRQIRMGCEERRDELEQQFTLELQNWMKYSQQTQQAIANPDFETLYSSENREVVQETISSTYRELYSSRTRRLNVIQRQCDETLEELLQNRKMSMIILVTELMKVNMDRLKDLVRELVSYRTQLQNGLQSCIQQQATQYVSRVSSKLLEPTDYCSGPDIDILTTFLKRMLLIIMEEQAQFFGDDEDLGMHIPCGISGCGEIADTQDSTYQELYMSTEQAPSNTVPPTHPTHLPSSNELPTRPQLPSYIHDHTQVHVPPSTDTASLSRNTDTTPQSTSISESTGELETSPPTGTPSQVTPEINPEAEDATTTEIKPPVTEAEVFTSTPERDMDITQPDSSTTAPMKKTVKPTVPEWLNDAVHEILHSEQQEQNQDGADTPLELYQENENEEEEGSHIHHHGNDRDGDNSSEDSRDHLDSTGNDDSDEDKTSNRHNGHGGSYKIVIDIPPADTYSDTAKQTSEENSAHHIYRPLIYSFATVGGLLVVATLVLVVAILIVQHKRRQLLATQSLTQEQKIAIMKQTGYVNPTYEFFDKQNDG